MTSGLVAHAMNERQEVADKLGLSVRGLGGEHTAIGKVRAAAAAALVCGRPRAWR